MGFEFDDDLVGRKILLLKEFSFEEKIINYMIENHIVYNKVLCEKANKF